MNLDYFQQIRPMNCITDWFSLAFLTNVGRWKQWTHCEIMGVTFASGCRVEDENGMAENR